MKIYRVEYSYSTFESGVLFIVAKDKSEVKRKLYERVETILEDPHIESIYEVNSESVTMNNLVVKDMFEVFKVLQAGGTI